MSKQTGTPLWQPQGEMTIYNALENQAALLKLLEATGQLDIDLSKVTEMDSAGLQLLILAKQEATRNNKIVRLIEHSDASLEVLELCNLSRLFEDQQPEAQQLDDRQTSSVQD